MLLAGSVPFPRLPGTKNVLNHCCHSNAACLAVPVVLPCPAASGPNWFAGPEWGLDGDETVEFDGTAGGISPLRGAGGKRRGIQFARSDPRVAVWRTVRRGVGLRGLARGVDGVGFHTDRRAFDQHPARVRPRSTILENNIVQTTGSAGESAAAGVIFTMPALIFLGFSLNTEYWRIFFLALLGGTAGRAVHDSAAAATDRERARESDFSGRHGVRGRAGGRRARRILCGPGVLGTGVGRPVHICDEHAADVAFAAGLSAEMAAGRVVPREHHFGIFGSGLHHRAARFRDAICRAA